VVGAVLVAALGATAVLTASPTLFAFLGRRGALALERLMGILLVMLSVQMVLDGVARISPAAERPSHGPPHRIVLTG
jgi:small neutral amino acid transporter SnatA (MarC family)